MAKKPSKIDWKLSSCCGKGTVKVAGIRRCSGCQRETVTEEHRGSFHMFDLHDFNYQIGEDE